MDIQVQSLDAAGEAVADHIGDSEVAFFYGMSPKETCTRQPNRSGRYTREAMPSS